MIVAIVFRLMLSLAWRVAMLLLRRATHDDSRLTVLPLLVGLRSGALCSPRNLTTFVIFIATLVSMGCLAPRTQESDRQRLNRLLSNDQDSDRPIKTKVFDDDNPMPVPLGVLELEEEEPAATDGDGEEVAEEAAAENAVGTGSMGPAPVSEEPTQGNTAAPEDAPVEICPPETHATPGEVPADLVLQSKSLTPPPASAPVPAPSTAPAEAIPDPAVSDPAAEGEAVESPASEASGTPDKLSEPAADAPAETVSQAEADAASPSDPPPEGADEAQDQAIASNEPEAGDAEPAASDVEPAASDVEPAASDVGPAADDVEPAGQASAVTLNETEAASSPSNTDDSDFQTLLHDAIHSLRTEVEGDQADELTLSVQRLRLQLLELAFKQPAWSKTPVVRDYIEQQTRVLQLLTGDEAQDEVAVINRTAKLAADSALQLNAAADLAVNHLSFCTEVSSFGNYRTFPRTTFRPGQEVVLYFELDHFVSLETKQGYETEFRVRYEILDAQGKRLMTQVLPTDHQTCKARRRDYFIAYLIYLPQVPAGDYTLALQVEDAKGQKRGLANHAFQLGD